MKNILNIFLVLGIIALIVSLIVKPTRETAPQTSGTIESTMKPSPSSKSLAKPELIINAKKTYSVTLQTTEGEIDILLDTKNTPQTANNFYYLAKSGFYDNVIFHRIIPGFMIQGGDPTGTGTGGPGYKFEDEKFVGEYTRGTVAMANSGPNTNG
ncbi:MAG: Peptidyl-prolyl cis-trans isomerase, partial [Microgenomates group bacterium GW2011_GWF2_47_9]